VLAAIVGKLGLVLAAIVGKLGRRGTKA
jgi:hypothetical protein